MIVMTDRRHAPWLGASTSYNVSGCDAALAFVDRVASGSSIRRMREGFPATTAQAGTDFVTTARAPIRA